MTTGNAAMNELGLNTAQLNGPDVVGPAPPLPPSRPVETPMVPPVQLWPLVTSVVRVGGVPVTVAYGPVVGGFVTNPYEAADQNLSAPEPLFVSMSGPASLGTEDGETFVLQPGETLVFPLGLDSEVSVNAPSGNHAFSGVIYHEPTGFTESLQAFPPAAQSTLTEVIPSYLYQQYNDDEDLLAFVAAYNSMAQEYVSWYAEVLLPVYNDVNVTSSLLDLVGAGIYGYVRPVLPSGLAETNGPLNTYELNTLELNDLEISGPDNFYVTDDDIYRRCLTWHLYKGDGKVFNVRWLKRRIKRFLTGIDGTEGDTGETYEVSVTFAGNQVNINFLSRFRIATGGALLNLAPLNDFELNELETEAFSVPISPVVQIFKAAVEAGVLELPFQYEFIVNVN